MIKNERTYQLFSINSYLVGFFNHFRGGMIKIDIASQPTIKIRMDNNNKIIFNVLSSDNSVIDSNNRSNDYTSKIPLRERLSEAKDFAKCIKESNLTFSVLYENKEIIVMGKEAKPKLTKLITGSNEIQIKNIRQLKKFESEILNA